MPIGNSIDQRIEFCNFENSFNTRQQLSFLVEFRFVKKVKNYAVAKLKEKNNSVVIFSVYSENVYNNCDVSGS